MIGGIMKREVHYIKPNMNNLRGRRGRRIFDLICNTPPVPEEERQRLKREADECMERILARRRNEQSSEE